MLYTCKELIKKILAALDDTSADSKDMSEISESAYQSLCDLDEECSPSLLGTAESLMGKCDAPGDQEYKFQIVLQALITREDDGAREITAAALLNNKTKDKETYLDLLIDMQDETTIPIILEALRQDKSEGELEGNIRFKAIAALKRFKAREVSDTVMEYLFDSSNRVRMEATSFLNELDVKAAAPLLLELLRKEDDPRNLKALATTLARWNYRESVSALQELLERNVSQQTTFLSSAVEEALRLLTVPPDA